jgi:metallophosphoesterase (TIGR00282 family)
VRILFVGDVVGRPGRAAVRELLPGLKRRLGIHFTIVNCENAAAGFGVTPEICEELFEAGADCLTGGNHSWKKREIYSYIDRCERLLRPANYPEGAPGRGWHVYQAGPHRIAVVNLLGLTHLAPLDCPFRAFDTIQARAAEETPLLVVDFHAEATSEKQALGWYADGRATAVIGTHTHVQTADERLLPGGTGYLTDVGMTGPVDGVLGVAREAVLEQFLTRMPVRFEVASGPAMLMAVMIEADPDTGRAISLARVQEPAP